MATCAEILGEQLPDDAGEDSVSFLPGPAGAGPRAAARGGGAPFDQRLLRHPARRLEAGALPRLRRLERPARDQAAAGLPPIQLYNLASDPGERHNVQDQHPDVVARLTRLLERYVADGRSTPGQPRKNDGSVVLRKPVEPVRSREARCLVLRVFEQIA